MSTLLTVGYGDIYPITTLGRIMAICIAYLGVGVVAIPIGIISAGFVEQYQRKSNISDLKDMDIKDKLRLGICISSSTYTNLRYNKAHIHSVFDKRLKEIDNEYLTSYVNMRKYPIILLVMAKIIEMNSQEQNQVAMYLYNTIKL